MNMFKQNKLVAAIAVGLGVASGGAGAVSLNADGVGEALVYPYYTARNGQTTLLSVVNTTANGKAVKVRFREARNSNDVLDFNLYLSPQDVWTGAVTAKGTGAYLTTNDTSCTNPVKSSFDAVDATNRVFGKAFFPFDYDSVDGTSTNSQGLDRTLEGYVEIIEMATIPTGSPLFPAIKHVNGVPPCELNSAGALLFASGGFFASNGNITQPSGGLFGAVAQLNTSGGVNGGVSTANAAVAYNNFDRPAAIQDPSSANPNFSDHLSCKALVNDGTTVALMDTSSAPGVCVQTDLARAFAAVNMASSVQGEYSFFRAADGGTAVQGTDWIITMPGKHYFTNLITWTTSTGDPHGYVVGSSSSPALAPFLNPPANGTALWSQSNKVSCLTISTTVYSREEDTAGGAGSGFSPRPPGTPANSLCYEANIISFGQPATTGGASAVFASPLALFLNPTFARSNTGWLDLPLNVTGATRQISGPVVGSRLNLSAGTSIPGGTVTVTGLPVIGFKSSVARVTAVSPGTPLNNYNDSVPLTFRRTVSVTTPVIIIPQ